MAPASKLLPNASPKEQQASRPADSPKSMIEKLRGKLASVNEELAQATDRAANFSPSGVATRTEIVEYGLSLQQLVRVYQRHIASLMKLQNLQQSFEQLEQESANWTGFPTPPPYSFIEVDELREKLDFQTEHLRGLQTMDSDLEQESARRKALLKESGEQLRQADEKLEGNPDGNPRWVWLRDLESMHNRVAEALVEGMQTEQQVNQKEMAKIRLQLDFTRRQLNTVKNQISFPAADRQKVRDRVADARQRLQAELESVLPMVDASHKSLDAANAALDQGRADLGKGGDLRSLADLENKAELQREKAENADIKLQAINRLLDSIRMREKIWELRWAMADSKDAQSAQQAYAKIGKLQAELNPIKEFVGQQMKLADEQVFNTEKQLLNPSSPALKDFLQQLNEIYAERESSYRRMMWGLDIGDHLLDLWRQDLDGKHQSQSLKERALEWLAQIRAGLADAWQFELFAAKDTIEVEGQQITGKRSVTLGKVLTALLILVVGLRISATLSYLFADRVAVKRMGMDAGSAHIARRWLLFLVGVILVLTSLVMVKIPLTIFAFTGGALAIGAGFGMQNLLKNLISGLMLLLERPFRPRDFIEVGGIRGRVMDIGVRSSRIRDENGIETLIPNSTLIEDNVTNWTLSSQSVRIVVKTGVAYGSPAREVTDLLLEAASRHKLILHDPPPQVLFEDFGSDALLFGLYVWVELKHDLDWRTVASDLRYMINKTFSVHGIVMAFPQRDIHVGSAEPLQVRLLREEIGSCGSKAT